MKPKYYNSQEGGQLLPWPLNKVTQAQLDHKRNGRAQGQDVIWIEGLQVHALFFHDGRAWDVINGWREGNHWVERAESYWAGCTGYQSSLDSDYCFVCGRSAAWHTERGI